MYNYYNFYDQGDQPIIPDKTDALDRSFIASLARVAGGFFAGSEN